MSHVDLRKGTVVEFRRTLEQIEERVISLRNWLTGRYGDLEVLCEEGSICEGDRAPLAEYARTVDALLARVRAEIELARRDEHTEGLNRTRKKQETSNESDEEGSADGGRGEGGELGVSGPGAGVPGDRGGGIKKGLTPDQRGALLVAYGVNHASGKQMDPAFALDPSQEGRRLNQLTELAGHIRRVWRGG